MRLTRLGRRFSAFSTVALAALVGGAGSGLLGVCGPFTDVAADSFCPFVFEVFTLGITTGTTPTTYDPATPVSRLQMAAFLSRTVDRTLQRASRRTVLDQFWTTRETLSGLRALGGIPVTLKSDGTDVWVCDNVTDSVFRLSGSDGKTLGTWTGATEASAVLSARSKIYVTGGATPGRLYRIDPSLGAGAVTTVASNLGDSPAAIAYDGSKIWTANFSLSAPVSIVTPGSIPWTVTTVTNGLSFLNGILYDGANIWVTAEDGFLVKLDSVGAALQTVTVGFGPRYPSFDGTNIWVPNEGSNSVSVVRASTGVVLATLTGNGLNGPAGAAFDGQRVLVTNYGGNSVSLWKAADLTTMGSLATGANSHPLGVCSDEISFWIALNGLGQILRF